jgi:hypothetical protein
MTDTFGHEFWKLEDIWEENNLCNFSATYWLLLTLCSGILGMDYPQDFSLQVWHDLKIH